MISILRLYIYIISLCYFMPSYIIYITGNINSNYIIIPYPLTIISVFLIVLYNDKINTNIVIDNIAMGNQYRRTPDNTNLTFFNYYLLMFNFKKPFFKVYKYDFKTDLKILNYNHNLGECLCWYGYFDIMIYLIFSILFKLPIFYTILLSNFINENRKILYFTAICYSLDIIYNFFAYSNNKHKKILNQFIKNIFALSYNFFILALYVFFFVDYNKDNKIFYIIQCLSCLSYDITILLLLLINYLVVLIFAGILFLLVTLKNVFLISKSCFAINNNQQLNNNDDNNINNNYNPNNNLNNNANNHIDINNLNNNNNVNNNLNNNNNNNNVNNDINNNMNNNANNNEINKNLTLYDKINNYISNNGNINIITFNNNEENNLDVNLDINELIDANDNTYINDISDIKNINNINNEYFKEHIIELNRQFKCHMCNKFNNKIIKIKKIDNNCAICMSKKADVLYLDCGHVYTCLECSINLNI